MIEYEVIEKTLFNGTKYYDPRKPEVNIFIDVIEGYFENGLLS